jgi:putative ABC transport system permease protein
MQLRYQKVRTTVALMGIAFAVILVFMQLGFRTSLFESAVRYHERFNYDIAIFSTESRFIVDPLSFSSRRLYQALGVEGVESVARVYVDQAIWKNPWNYSMQAVLVLGVDPDEDVLRTPGVSEGLDLIRQRDVILFDAHSRPEHGPVADRFRAGERVETEVNNRQVVVGGLYELGTSFGIDGNILTSEDNFLRLYPGRPRSQIDIGLVRILPGRDPERVRDAIAAVLPQDVLVLTQAQFIDREVAYWDATTPIGYVFAFGAVMGFVVGAIIVYQMRWATRTASSRAW